METANVGPYNLDNKTNMWIIIAILVKRLGGSVSISPEEADEVAFNYIDEFEEGGVISLQFVDRDMVEH